MTTATDDTIQTVAELQRQLLELGVKQKLSDLSDLAATQRAALRQWCEAGGTDPLPTFAKDWKIGKAKPKQESNGKPAEDPKQQALDPDWQDQYPEPVMALAEEYDKAHTAHQKTKGKLTTAKENLIEAMKEHDCPKVRIRNGEKFLRLTHTEQVKIEKPKQDDGDDE